MPEEPITLPAAIVVANELIELKAPGRALHSMRVEENANGDAINIILFLKSPEPPAA